MMEPEKTESCGSLQSVSPSTVLIDSARPSSTSRGTRPADPPIEGLPATTSRGKGKTSSKSRRNIDVERGRLRSRSNSRSPPPPPSSNGSDRSDRSLRSVRSDRSQRSERSERSARGERRDRKYRADRRERSSRGDRGDKRDGRDRKGQDDLYYGDSHRTASMRSSGSERSAKSTNSIVSASSSRPLQDSNTLRSHHQDNLGRTERHRSRSSSHTRRTGSMGQEEWAARVSMDTVPPRRSLVRSWLQTAWASRQCRRGFGLFVAGLLLMALAGVVDIEGNAYRHAKIREAIVVDAPNHPEFKAWATGAQQKTPLLYTYHLYNITNPEEFLAGQPPQVHEVGPFSFQQRTKKINVTFSDEGRLVSYITQIQHEFTGDPEELDRQSVYSLNLPYSVAIYTAGSESNLLKIGSQQGLAEVLFQMKTYFLPALKENAVVMAIQMAVDAMTQILNAMQAPSEATATRWGGGCTSNMFGKICGFSTVATFFSAVDKRNKMDLNLLQLCINTKLTEAEQIPLATVRRLWDPTDVYSIMNVDRGSAAERYGISYWLWGDVDVRDTIAMHFGITIRQYNALRAYLLDIYRSPMLEMAVVKIFLESLPPEDAGTAEVAQWSDFLWRQWAVGDVVTRLKNESMARPESMQPELPPEFAWYAEKAGYKTFTYGGKRLNRTQAKCTFDLAKRPMVYFQTYVLGLPGPSISRPTFVDFGLEDSGEPLIDPRDCFQSKNDWALLQGYLAYLAEYFVAPLLQEDVLDKNGGLVTRKTLRECLYGYSAPILQLSLAKDDPRAMKFSLLANDPSLDGPGRCLSSNDVENPFTACRFSSRNITQNMDGSEQVARIFDKVPNTYHTGRDDTVRAGAFYTYRGDRSIADIWPGGSIPFAGGTKDLPGSIQYGYSDGMQFPPFGAIDGPNVVLSVFVPGFVLPLRFAFSEDVDVQGVKLKRFRLVPETFSSSRSDAKTFGMDKVQQEGLFNLTGLMTGLTYFSKPHYRPTPPFDMSDVGGLAGFDPARDDSYIDVEPVTGKTMNANIQLQLNAGITPEAFDKFHNSVYPVKALPVLHVAQHAGIVPEDAKFFKNMVYGTEKLIKLTTIISASVGALLLLIGLALLLHHALRHGAAVAAAELGLENNSLKGVCSKEATAVEEGDVEMAITKRVRASSSYLSTGTPPDAAGMTTLSATSAKTLTPPRKPPSKRGEF